MDNPGQTIPDAQKYDALPDDDLRKIMDKVGGILRTREQERCKNAVSQIRRLAKENGLTVSVKKTGRKRGRPPKHQGNRGAKPLPAG